MSKKITFLNTGHMDPSYSSLLIRNETAAYDVYGHEYDRPGQPSLSFTVTDSLRTSHSVVLNHDQLRALQDRIAVVLGDKREPDAVSTIIYGE